MPATPIGVPLPGMARVAGEDVEENPFRAVPVLSPEEAFISAQALTNSSFRGGADDSDELGKARKKSRALIVLFSCAVIGFVGLIVLLRWYSMGESKLVHSDVTVVRSHKQAKFLDVTSSNNDGLGANEVHDKNSLGPAFDYGTDMGKRETNDDESAGFGSAAEDSSSGTGGGADAATDDYTFADGFGATEGVTHNALKKEEGMVETPLIKKVDEGNAAGEDQKEDPDDDWTKLSRQDPIVYHDPDESDPLYPNNPRDHLTRNDDGELEGDWVSPEKFYFPYGHNDAPVSIPKGEYVPFPGASYTVPIPSEPPYGMYFPYEGSMPKYLVPGTFVDLSYAQGRLPKNIPYGYYTSPKTEGKLTKLPAGKWVREWGREPQPIPGKAPNGYFIYPEGAVPRRVPLGYHVPEGESNIVPDAEGGKGMKVNVRKDKWSDPGQTAAVVPGFDPQPVMAVPANAVPDKPGDITPHSELYNADQPLVPGLGDLKVGDVKNSPFPKKADSMGKGKSPKEKLVPGFGNMTYGDVDGKHVFFSSQAPTLHPTMAPTTLHPTRQPTTGPTPSPTAEPTQHPTQWDLSKTQAYKKIGVEAWEERKKAVIDAITPKIARDEVYRLDNGYKTFQDRGVTVVQGGNNTVDVFDSSSAILPPPVDVPRSNNAPGGIAKADLSKYPYIITTTNEEYGHYDTWYPYLDILPGGQIVEPNKMTKYEVKTQQQQLARRYLGAVSYLWKRSYDNATHIGESWDFVVIKPGMFLMTLDQLDGAGTVLHSFKTRIYSKYVKRELRKLSPQDKENFLSAAALMYRMPTKEGRAIYGDKYTSAATLVEEHSLASNDITCDGYHDGSGFFTHHFAITSSYEASIRSINPHVTLPYWDFTIEGQLVTAAKQTPRYFLEVTPFLSDDWFGASDPDTNFIINSKFAGIKAPKVTNESIVQPNSYGYIRSYWNHNNDSEVTRHVFDTCGVEAKNKPVPDCKSHMTVMNVTTLGKFQLLSPSDGHGPVHVQIGGIYGACVQKYKDFYAKYKKLLETPITAEEVHSLGYKPEYWEWGYDAPRKHMLNKIIMGEYFHIYRMLWRSHICSRDQTKQLLHCPDCTTMTPEQIANGECRCYVPGLEEGTQDWEDVYYCVVNGNKRHLFSTFFPEEFRYDLTMMIATTTIQEGDMLEAASPADITFWVIHPTIERLLAAKRLQDDSITFAGLPFNRWEANSGIRDGSNETWLTASTYNFAPGTNAAYPEGNYCFGHGKDDDAMASSLPWLPGFHEIADTDGDGKVTNWEYFIALDPNLGYGTDYVFDDFRWDHCLEAGLPGQSNYVPTLTRPKRVPAGQKIKASTDGKPTKGRRHHRN